MKIVLIVTTLLLTSCQPGPTVNYYYMECLKEITSGYDKCSLRVDEYSDLVEKVCGKFAQK